MNAIYSPCICFLVVEDVSGVVAVGGWYDLKIYPCFFNAADLHYLHPTDDREIWNLCCDTGSDFDSFFIGFVPTPLPPPVTKRNKIMQPVEMTAEQREKSEADIRAIFAKFGDDPTDFIKALPSTYKPSDGNLLC